VANLPIDGDVGKEDREGEGDHGHDVEGHQALRELPDPRELTGKGQGGEGARRDARVLGVCGALSQGHGPVARRVGDEVAPVVNLCQGVG